MESRGSRARGLGGTLIGLVALLAALTVGPASAQAASPVLEFVPSGASFPIEFEAEGATEVSAQLEDFSSTLRCAGSEGEGLILGPRTADGSYYFTECFAHDGANPPAPCKSAGANDKEIVAEDVHAELVYIDQANHEVGMLLNPGAGVYMKFSCGGEPVEARGPFLSPVGEVNTVADAFGAVLLREGTEQIPHEYEGPNGETRQALPSGKRESSSTWEASAVELAFEIFTAAPLEIRAINSAEVEAKQREEEAAAKERQEQEAAAKKRQDEQAAKDAAAKKLAEEQAAQHAAELRRKRQAQVKKRAQHRAKALRQCRKLKSNQKRKRCETRVKKQYRAPQAHSSAARF